MFDNAIEEMLTDLAKRNYYLTIIYDKTEGFTVTAMELFLMEETVGTGAHISEALTEVYTKLTAKD